MKTMDRGFYDKIGTASEEGRRGNQRKVPSTWGSGGRRVVGSDQKKEIVKSIILWMGKEGSGGGGKAGLRENLKRGGVYLTRVDQG